VAPVLVVVGGLPATGKSTIATALARRTSIPYLRVIASSKRSLPGPRCLTRSDQSVTRSHTHSCRSSLSSGWT
jgi:predicted kinase